jgi:hypothetical protein
MRSRALVSIALVFGLCSGAEAGGVLASAPHNFTSALMTCLMVNIGKKPIDVRVELFDAFGQAVPDTVAMGTVQPNRQLETSAQPPAGAKYCRITVEKGSPKSVRAQVVVLETFTNTFLFSPVS